MKHVALIRGINVGAHHRMKMETLRKCFAAAGARDVQTYIQSGNVVFSHAKPDAAKLAKAIADETGFDVGVVVRTATEWKKLAHPFPDDEHVHVFFTADPAKLAIDAKGTERYVVKGREVYLYLPDGIGRSKLAGAVAKALPQATARNWRTVQQLLAMTVESAQ
jgi:uncharacterized protein (DUF1697 family)